MKTRLLSLGLVLLALPGASPAQDDAPEIPDIKAAIDQSIRWLRSTQDPKSGAYGGGVEPTAWVLRALATSPRKYAAHDGPFVQAALDFLVARQADDGSIHDASAAGEATLAQTRAAAAALAFYPEEPARAALGRALVWLTDHGVDDPNAGGVSFANDESEALRRAVKRLSERAPDGSWNGAGGRVLATARALVELAADYEWLKKDAPPRGVKPLPAFDDADGAAAGAAIERGARFLMQVAEDGRWGAPGHADAGLTSMVLAALQTLPEPRPADVQKVVDDGLAWLASLQHEDGSIHDGRLASYVTSSCILALARSSDPRYAKTIARARDFLVTLQADEGEGYSPDHPYYGGIGYGGDERPDLSNLQMALEALAASGLEKDHAAFARAVTFLQRCQNRSESNAVVLASDGAVVVSGDDGGAAYMPGNSPAGYVELEDGRKVPRSYGSMSYALLKGFIFAGVPKDDPRMKACWEWLSEHYTVDVNPGFEMQKDPGAAYQGLFYYFHTMARALDLYGVELVTDAHGTQHAWRKQLCGRLIAMQSRLDGSWVNANAPRWWEGNPVLATAYALLTLEAARP